MGRGVWVLEAGLGRPQLVSDLALQDPPHTPSMCGRPVESHMGMRALKMLPMRTFPELTNSSVVLPSSLPWATGKDSPHLASP